MITACYRFCPADEWHVTATHLTSPGRNAKVEWRRLDVRDQSAVLGLFKATKPDVVIHTAAVNPGRGSDFEAVNTQGTANVAHAANLVDGRLIHVSSDVVFDGEKGNYVEGDSPSPVTPYGRSKARAEEAVRTSGAHAVIVRTSLIYGPAAPARITSRRRTPWQHWDRQTRWVVGDLKAGEPVALFIDEKRCPIWVESLASALVELAGRVDLWKLQTDVLHVGGAQPLSRYGFGVRLARHHGVDPASIIPALSRQSGLKRPLDCTLDSSRARTLFHTLLPAVDEALELPRATPDR